MDISISNTDICILKGVVGWCEGAGRGVLLIWIIVGQEPTALAVGPSLGDGPI